MISLHIIQILSEKLKVLLSHFSSTRIETEMNELIILQYGYTVCK